MYLDVVGGATRLIVRAIKEADSHDLYWNPTRVIELPARVDVLELGL
jgi:hypothetical protein